MILVRFIAPRHNGTFRHRHDHRADKAGHAAKAHIEGGKDRTHNTVNANDQTGGLELAQLAAIEVPVCIIATAVAIVFYIIKDRKMVQKYYK